MGQKQKVMIAAMLCIGVMAKAHASDAPPRLAALNLVCSGRAEKTENTGKQNLISEDGDVRLYLEGDGGSAELPRFMGGPKTGRQVVRLFTVTDTMITGKINHQPFGNAKFRIDRIAGTVSITGPIGDFSGRCQPFDPARTAPKF